MDWLGFLPVILRSSNYLGPPSDNTISASHPKEPNHSRHESPGKPHWATTSRSGSDQIGHHGEQAEELEARCCGQV